MTTGTAAAVPPARPHTGETAGVTPEEESTETERRHTSTHILTTKNNTRARNTTNTSMGTAQRRTHTQTEASHQNKACHQQINKPPTPEHTPVSSPPTYPVPISYLWAWLCGIEAGTAGGHTPPLLRQVAFCTVAACFNAFTWCRKQTCF